MNRFITANTVKKYLDKLPNTFTFQDIHDYMNEKRELTTVSRSTVSNYTRSMMHWGMVEFKRKGKNGYYYEKTEHYNSQ